MERCSALPTAGACSCLTRGIARLDPETYRITMVAESPSRIETGGDYLDGRIYFGTGAGIQSWQVPPVVE